MYFSLSQISKTKENSSFFYIMAFTKMRLLHSIGVLTSFFVNSILVTTKVVKHWKEKLLMM